jgi:branched-chain amino acid transport system permease protein
MDYLTTILCIMGLHILLALSVYVTLATGQFSLAQVGFWAIGAYSSAILTTMYNFPLIPSLIIAALLCGIIGAVVGYPCLRIRGIYLALATLGFSEMVRVFFLNFRFQKMIGDKLVGPDGVLGFRYVKVLTSPWHIYCIVILTIIFFLLLEKSRLGLAFKAIQEDDLAANSAGINIVFTKVLAFSIGAAIAGIGGGLYANYMSYITSQDFAFNLTLVAVLFVALGGIETFYGPIVGAIILTILPEYLRFLQEYRMMFYGALVLVITIFRPKGLIDREVLDRLKTVVLARR